MNSVQECPCPWKAKRPPPQQHPLAPLPYSAELLPAPCSYNVLDHHTKHSILRTETSFCSDGSLEQPMLIKKLM